jgi:hypothetical protein
MSARLIQLTDEQLTLLASFIEKHLHDEEDASEADREKLESFVMCCHATVNEPEDRNMIHGFTL